MTQKYKYWNGEKMELLHLDEWTFFEGEICHRNGPSYPVVQYTGLKDKNGVDIFEGDIVYVAGYGNMLVEFPFIDLYEHSFENDIGEILGDQFENPDLLYKRTKTMRPMLYQ